ncbi:MAG: putative MFS-type transporter YfcJ [Holosporales bacterium]
MKAHRCNQTLWGISITCFFWSLSSCMVFSILPTFMTEELQLTPLHLGMIEGVAISLAFLAKIVSGLMSDYYQTRKQFILIGTLLSLLFKIFFALATNGWWIFFAKSLDRFSKGIRSSPADALIADISNTSNQGRAYGLRQTFYTLGAVLGSLCASFLLTVTGHNYRLIFWASLIPVGFSLLIIHYFVHDIKEISQKNKLKWNLNDCKKLPKTFWQIIAVSFLLMLSRFSDSFLALKARDIGLSVAMLPLLMMVYDLVHSACSLPTGYMADKFKRDRILLLGLFILIITNGIMFYASSSAQILVGYIFAGLHMGLTHGLLSTLIAEHTLVHLRGTAFSIYYFSTGISVLFANHFAGFLSHFFKNASVPFLGGGIFSSLSFILLLLIILKNKKK